MAGRARDRAVRVGHIYIHFFAYTCPCRARKALSQLIRNISGDHSLLPPAFGRRCRPQVRGGIRRLTQLQWWIALCQYAGDDASQYISAAGGSTHSGLPVALKSTGTIRSGGTGMGAFDRHDMNAQFLCFLPLPFVAFKSVTAFWSKSRSNSLG